MPKRKKGQAPRSSAPKVHLIRDDKAPFERHLEPCWEVSPENRPGLALSKAKAEFLAGLPKPKVVEDGLEATWNSVALFFNLPSADRPGGYRNTTVQDARNWLDEGTDPADPTISAFMRSYWGTLSYGRFSFGVNTPRDASGAPLVPTLSAPGGDSNDWSGLIRAFLDAHAEAVWRAAGSLTDGAKRRIPSLALVQNYPAHASAFFGGYERTVGGRVYQIGDTTHIGYNLDFTALAGVPANKVRNFWATLCHEYGHNFVEFWDLYGPQGCTGYWDLLGDNSPPGRMSEVCSHLKNRIGWLSFKHVINGPSYSARNLSLRPYSTTGEAIKVVPDPAHNPNEFFLLEYRKSTGPETWRPDGALSEEGLLITHINERLGVSGVWLMRDAPYFDPEFADFSDNGGTLWTGHDRLNGVLYPNGSNNAFARWSSPNSSFYGGRPSGLSVTNISVSGGRVNFRLGIAGNPRVAWQVSNRDRAMAGRFTPESAAGGQEIFIRDNDNAALLVHRQAQWLAVARQNDWIGGWNLGGDNYEVVGDLDGDGRDEIYIRSPNWAGVLKWDRGRFNSVTVQHDWIDGWNLGSDNHELAADVDGDGAHEIFIRSPEWAGILKLVGDRLRLQSIQHDWIDDWNLGRVDQEFIGRFSQTERDEILIRSPEWLGLLYWHPTQRRLRLRRIQHDWIDGWNLGGVDKQCVGDFDGDGRDEIYIRSPRWAGVIKWRSGAFRLLWIRQNNLEHLSGEASRRIGLLADDRSYSGRFLPDRDGILHRKADSVAVLTWEGSQMQIRHHMQRPFGGAWNFASGDKLVLGDFHRVGRDIGDPALDYIGDNLTDVFMHNAWGTGMFGVNYARWNPARPADIREEIGLTWINPSEILFDT